LAAVSPGELLLTDIAAGFLALASPEQVPLHPSAARPGPLSRVADGLADIIAALQAAPPAGDLPERWLSLLAYRRRGKPERAPVLGWAVTASELPELDGARVTVLGLHNGGHGQFLHLLASGVTPEYTWPYGTIANCMPLVWLRDRDGRWHTARPGLVGTAAGYGRFPAVAEGRAAAGPRHPVDRRGGHRAIGRGSGQAAAELESANP